MCENNHILHATRPIRTLQRQLSNTHQGGIKELDIQDMFAAELFSKLSEKAKATIIEQMKDLLKEAQHE